MQSKLRKKSQTTFKQMGDDIVNSGMGQALQNGYNRGKGYGTTMLHDLDAFYHNADGSYDRTKVGLTAAAGLGIAGIAGYNMNN